MPMARCKTLDARCKTQVKDARCKLQYARCKLQITRYNMRFKFPDKQFHISDARQLMPMCAVVHCCCVHVCHTGNKLSPEPQHAFYVIVLGWIPLKVGGAVGDNY